MNKVLQSIKDFVIEPKVILDEVKDKAQGESSIVEDALAHYCEKCKAGFRTRGARNSHISLKHKNG